MDEMREGAAHRILCTPRAVYDSRPETREREAASKGGTVWERRPALARPSFAISPEGCAVWLVSRVCAVEIVTALWPHEVLANENASGAACTRAAARNASQRGRCHGRGMLRARAASHAAERCRARRSIYHSLPRRRESILRDGTVGRNVRPAHVAAVTVSGSRTSLPIL